MKCGIIISRMEDRNDSQIDEPWKAEAVGRGLGGTSSGEGGSDQARSEAKALGRAAEEGAAQKEEAPKGESDTEKARGQEHFKYTSSDDDDGPRSQARRIMGRLNFGGKRGLRRYGPAGLILAVVIALAGLFAGSGVMAPFMIVANGLDQFNSLRAAMSRRSDYFMRFSMNPELNKSITKATIFHGEQFKIGKSQQKKLAANGIDYMEVEGTDGKKLRLLVYTDDKTGDKIPIVANEKDLSRIPELDVGEATLRDGVLLDTAMKSDDYNFRPAVDVATRTVKGNIAGWFDTLADRLHNKRISNSRNKFRNTDNNSSDEDIQAAAKKNSLNTDLVDGVKAEKPGEESGETEEKTETVNVTNEDGSTTTKTETRTVTDGTNASKMASTVSKGGTRAKIGEKLTNVSEFLTTRTRKVMLAGSGGELGCMILKGIGSIGMLVSALQTAEVLNFVTAFLESVNIAQSEGRASAMNYFMKNLQKKGDTYANAGEEPVRRNTSSMESVAMNAFAGGPAVSPDDEVAQKFNLDYMTQHVFTNSDWMREETGDGGDKNSVLGSLVSTFGQTMDYWASPTGTMAAFQICNTARATIAAIGMTADFIGIIGGAFTGGIGIMVEKTAKEVVKGLVKATMMGIAMSVMGMVISQVTPIIAENLTRDLITDMAGEDAGYAIRSGFNAYLGRNMQQSSGMLGTKEQVLAQWRENEAVIAEDAESERRRLSPFDITSKNTFLGSIVNRLVPIQMQISGSPLGTMANAMGATTSSLKSVLPVVGAVSDSMENSMTMNEECVSLEMVDEDTVGDAFCNPYFVADFSTVSMNPYDVFEKVETGTDGRENFVDTSVENPKIKDDSEFAYWVISCTQRDSQFGYVDQQINSSLFKGDTPLSTIMNMGISAVPVAGDALDLAEVAGDVDKLEWATGAACVNNENSKYYSQYSQDQRVMEGLNIIDQSAVTSFLDEYYEKNPVDNSLEGVIARYSGMSKDQVEDTLALIEYARYIAAYSEVQGELGPAEPAKEPEMPQFGGGDVVAEVLPVGPVAWRVVYADLRGRTTIG